MGVERKVLIWLALVCVLLASALPLSACDKLGGLKVGFAGGNEANRIYGRYMYFNDTDTRTISAKTGQIITFTYVSAVTSGELAIKVWDGNKSLAAELETNTSGTKDVAAVQIDNYTLEITGKETKGSYDVRWEIK
jgi:hypothetical protein